jgi:hypothetical protein
MAAEKRGGGESARRRRSTEKKKHWDRQLRGRGLILLPGLFCLVPFVLVLFPEFSPNLSWPAFLGFN